MSDLQTQSTHQFDFNGFNLEVFAVDDAPWFIARPLAEYLGYQNPARDIRTNCDEWDIQNMYIPYKSNNYVCVNESGLYSLVLRSNKPEAKKFKKWVTSEVLPSIRKSGFYAAAKPDPVNLIQSVVTVFEGNLKLADLIGREGNQRILSASKATQSLTGTDVLKLLNVPALTAPTQESLLTPSALGKELGLKPAATNKLL